MTGTIYVIEINIPGVIEKTLKVAGGTKEQAMNYARTVLAGLLKHCNCIRIAAEETCEIQKSYL